LNDPEQMKSHPLVSVLIPVYNSGKYLSQCLDSIINQTYRPIHVAIIDDGSTDDSLAISKDYASKYPFIEVSTQRNSGVAVTRNNLLSKTKGDYSIYIDSDDWIESDMIEALMDYICQYNLDIAICSSIPEHNDSVTIVDKSRQTPLIQNREQIIKKFLFHKELNGSLWNKLVKTSLLHNLGFDPEISYGEDALFMWQVLQRVDKVGTVSTPYYHYRMNDASISHQTFGPKKMSGHKVWATIHAQTSRFWPQYEQIARASYAISDMWLMFYAALDRYPMDNNIRLFQKNLKDNIRLIYKSKLLSLPKMCMAYCLMVNYNFAGQLIKFIHKN